MIRYKEKGFSKQSIIKKVDKMGYKLPYGQQIKQNVDKMARQVCKRLRNSRTKGEPSDGQKAIKEGNRE